MSIVCKLIGHKYNTKADKIGVKLGNHIFLTVEVQTCARCKKKKYTIDGSYRPITNEDKWDASDINIDVTHHVTDKELSYAPEIPHK